MTISEEFIPAKQGTIIGGLDFLDNYILRGEKANAISKLCQKHKTNIEESKISDDEIGCIGVSLLQKDTNTSRIRVS